MSLRPRWISGRLLFWGPFVVAFSKGRMGYRHTRLGSWFKIVINRCEWCNERPKNCTCFDRLGELYDHPERPT